MKKTLLLLFCIISSLSYAQAPVNNYFSVPNSQFAIIGETVNQSASGANATWAFGTLTQTGTNTDTFSTTDPNIANYPGTTNVLTINDGSTSSQIFHKVTGSTLSLTGATNPQFNLDYNTDNALVGTYPLVFGNAATNDAIAGTITAQGITESYTGAIFTEVDAHGTLSFTVTGQGSYSGSVTRVKTEQNVSFLALGAFPGTAHLTNYNYYKNSDGALVFRYTEGVLDLPPFVNNQAFASTEGLITNTLSVTNNVLEDTSIKLYPNPVTTNLNIQLDSNLTMESVKIINIHGKTVLATQRNVNTINVSKLQAGFYLVTINTNEGAVTRKLIKK